MRFISWNVNGVRAVVKKGFADALGVLAPDVLCLQETRAQHDQVKAALDGIDGYHLCADSAQKKGYAGTAVLSRIQPLEVRKGMGIDRHDREGRVLAIEFENFFLINVYTPNSGTELKRLDYRREWDADFLEYTKKLEKEKPLIICGDMNVAHRPIDLARPEANYNKTAGYTQVEIDGMDNLLEAGFVDTFRRLHPDTVKYSWWSFRGNARKNNVGWRIDYFLTSPAIVDRIVEADIFNDVTGSDHCPTGLELTP